LFLGNFVSIKQKASSRLFVQKLSSVIVFVFFRHTNKKERMVSEMTTTDTIKLLRECDAGTKMAISSIDEVIERVQDQRMKNLLQKSKNSHEKLENEIYGKLAESDTEEKEPSVMAKSMSWMKTNIKMTMDNSDAAVADLITDGCDMGVKSLHRYMNQYQNADDSVKSICRQLISLEEYLSKELRVYL